jgi:replicative DNA helicase|tara:strand:+ start:2896 stop:4275 length:1380 start_codon:yes stop_codon:yes gene_type:complete
MSGKNNFGYLGYNFQIKLLNQLILDKNFTNSIVEVIEARYFDNQYFKLVMQMIKEYHEKYNVPPSFDALDQITRIEVSSEMARTNIFDMLKDIKDCPYEDHLWVQEKSLKFCKQQELQKAITKVNKILDDGDFEAYDRCEEYIREAIQVGEIDESTIDAFSSLEEVLKDDFREPVPTGIVGIDNLLDGGLAKGEIGVFLAPTGVGKSTILTKVANSAYNLGFNVLQIFFEDNPKIIQRKHLTCWTGISSKEQAARKTEVLEKISQYQGRGKLLLEKLPSDTMTMAQIKNRVRKLMAEDVKIDLVVLDYIDCLLPDRAFSDEWKGEGSVMRQFEAMCSELNVVGWTAAQGNRTSISSDVVTTDMMGGSIKKAQVGHVIISIAKSLQQKELGLATIAITKSRIGKDGIVFENCKFDNEFLEISTEQSQTLLDLEHNREERNALRVRAAMQRRNQTINQPNG